MVRSTCKKNKVSTPYRGVPKGVHDILDPGSYCEVGWQAQCGASECRKDRERKFVEDQTSRDSKEEMRRLGFLNEILKIFFINKGFS